MGFTENSAFKAVHLLFGRSIRVKKLFDIRMCPIM